VDESLSPTAGTVNRSSTVNTVDALTMTPTMTATLKGSSGVGKDDPMAERRGTMDIACAPWVRCGWWKTVGMLVDRFDE